MDRFYGFDLGDAESAVARLDRQNQSVPEILPVGGAKSFVTAYASLSSGELVIGEKACFAADAVRRKLRFKSRYLRDPESRKDLASFAAGVLGELYLNADLIKNEDCCFYIGCPAGWSRNDRERYREIFEKAGYPPVKIVSESRAAMVSACQSKHLQVGYDILSKPVLVVDIGSSTTDFAYIMGGKEVEMQTGGEVVLGGGIMDEILLEESVRASGQEAQIRAVFAESEPWKNYCEFAARRLKEKYYSDETYWADHTCTETVMIYYKGRQRLTLRMDEKMADRLVQKGSPSLNGRSFAEVFLESLRQVRENVGERLPELVFLTGGVSRLPAVRDWCEEVFPESVVVMGTEPEFSVCRGLAWSGRIDQELREFREDLNELIASSKVEKLVRSRMEDLYRGIVNALIKPLLEEAALPVFDRWRSKEIRTLEDADGEIQREIEKWLHTEKARQTLGRAVGIWLKPIADLLEEDTVPICVRHGIPYTALSLNSYFAASDIEFHVNARDVFAIEEITLMIDSIITLCVGLLCGGSGLALISGGPIGVFAGVLISFLVLLLGKNKMEEAILKVNFPKPVRLLVPKSMFRSRMDSMEDSIKHQFYEFMENGKNEQITERLTEEISGQIEECLTRMAQVVEIPLG